MIIAVDYDGTLEDRQGHMNAGLIRALANYQVQGHTIILWTCRGGKSLKEAVDKLGRWGLRPNYINQNAPAVIRRLGHDPRKVWADVYVDDKARGL